jgi:hypothetical protein
MPLRDHFRSPVNDKHHWSEVHGQWPGELVRTLFDLLPPGFQAGPKVTLGSPFEVDVSATENDDRPELDTGAGGTATLTAAPTLTVTADLSEPDAYEVRVYDAERQRTLVAAIEIVSPANKDRPNKREQFTGKVANLLRQDVCVVIVDVVTNRLANLYAEVIARFDRADPALGRTPPVTYAVTLRPRKAPRIQKKPRKPSLLDAWFFPLAVGQPLPTIPLWLGPDLRIELPLEPSYQEVCRLLRIA